MTFQQQPSYPIPPEEVVSNAIMDVLLSIVTCGIYYFFWMYRRFRALNALLGREEFSFVLWFLLSLVTCSIYHIYIEYQMAQRIIDIQRSWGRPVNENFPLISLLVCIFGFAVIADVLQQGEINSLYGRP